MISTECYKSVVNGLGLKQRDGQLKLIEAIESTLLKEEGNKICVGSAGTGTGKGLAYLCGAVPYAVKENKTVIISTGTVQLQNQLIEKDLPAFLDHCGLDVQAELAKGRGRYLCPRKLELEIAKNGTQELVALTEKFNAGEWDGELDSINKPTSWNNICSNRHDCPGIECASSNICPFIQSRNRLKSANIIVSNHDLTLADLSLEGAILSDPEETIFVFDEGHHLPDKAISQFSFSYSTQEANDWAQQASEYLAKHESIVSEVALEDEQKIEGNLDSYLEHIGMLNQLLSSLKFDTKKYQDQSYQQARFAHGMLPENILIVAQQCRNVWKTIHSGIDNIGKSLKECTKSNDSRALAALDEIGHIINKSERANNLWLGFAHKDRAGQIPRARWVIANKNGFTLHCAAINASKALNTFLFSKAYATILTSATLLVDQSFESFARETGLPEDTTYVTVESPFDYPSVGTIHVPKTSVDPKQVEVHTNLIADHVSREVDLNKATLVIFSSYRQMNAVYDLLPDHIVDFVLKQGSMNKQAIIETHKSRIDEGRGSIIFGLQQSWGEGVDLAGEYASNVVICKLSFTVPDDPVAEARSEYVQSSGRNPFLELQVPEATIRLVQTVGRLIRTERDTGTVTILDNRIVKKRYGQIMLNSLPPLKLVM